MNVPDMNWQPIETAPYDENILVTQDGHVFIARSDRNYPHWWTDEDRYNDCERFFPPRGVNPTHWMPLPEPPEQTP